MSTPLEMNKKRISEVLRFAKWDQDSSRIISKIGKLDGNLVKINNCSSLQIFSLNKMHLLKNTGIYIENFGVDVSLDKEIIYVNKNLDEDTKTVLSILAAFTANKHLTNWPSIPMLDNENDINEYNYSIQKLNSNLDIEMTSLLDKIFETSDLERKKESYVISFYTTNSMYFGINKVLRPNFRTRPFSTVTL